MLQTSAISYKSTRRIHNSYSIIFVDLGHDEHTCRRYELMMDRTPTYKVQAESRSLDQNAGMARTEF